MDYLTSMEMSKVWGISSRRVSLLCSEGRVAGADCSVARAVSLEQRKKEKHG